MVGFFPIQALWWKVRKDSFDELLLFHYLWERRLRSESRKRLYVQMNT